MRLWKKNFFSILIVFSVTTVILVCFIYYISNSLLLEKYKDVRKENIDYIEDRLENEIFQLNKTFDYIVNNDVILRRLHNNYKVLGDYQKVQDDKDVDSILAALSLFDTFNSVETIYMESISGEQYYYGKSCDPKIRQKIRKYTNGFEFSRNSLIYLGMGRSFYEENNENKSVLKFARNLYDDFGKQIGWMYTELNNTCFKKIFSADKIYDNTEMYLLDGQGNYICSTSGTPIKEIERTDNIWTENELSQYQWRFVSVTEEKIILEDSHIVFRITVIFVSIMVIIEIFLSILVTNRITSPINNLAIAMNKVREGKYQIQIETQGNDEIADLTKVFNQMTQDIQKNIDKEIKMQKEIKDAEYRALQAQINPHFMYNSLNAIKFLAKIQKADNIIRAIDALWNLLKITSQIDGEFVPLKIEGEIVKACALLQNLRYKGKFTIFYEIDKEDESFVVPKFILQPLVENAIFHGIEPKKGTGKIRIYSIKKDGDIYLIVEDDGIGISEEKIQALFNEKNKFRKRGINNIGIKNVHERLQLLYGKTYGVSLSGREGEGTIATVKIPISRQEDSKNV